MQRQNDLFLARAAIGRMADHQPRTRLQSDTARHRRCRAHHLDRAVRRSHRPQRQTARNGFLTAALLGGALHLLDRRPWLAGVLIGCLAYKPQFGVLIPIALLAGGRWTTIGAAVATVAALFAVSVLALGGGVWHAFADS